MSGLMVGEGRWIGHLMGRWMTWRRGKGNYFRRWHGSVVVQCQEEEEEEEEEEKEEEDRRSSMKSLLPPQGPNQSVVRFFPGDPSF